MLPRFGQTSRPVPASLISNARLLLALLVAWAGHGHAQEALGDPWRLCPPSPERAPLPPASTGSTLVTADQARMEGERGRELSVFEGNVVAERDGKRLLAEQARYDTAADVVTATGEVELQAESITLQGQKARLDFAADKGELEAAHYYVPNAHARGTAERMRFEGSDWTELEDATYTTCPEGTDSWALGARRIELDRATNTGEAYHVTLRLGGVPTFYLPYLNFPLEGRKSGFLAPTYGSSERNGTDIQVPWYWNIAPNRDATFTPRVISKRGSMLMTEFRQLTADSSSLVMLDYLPDDELYGDDRSHIVLRHSQRLAPRWNMALDYNEVSDDDYLDDIDGSLAGASATHLERRFDLTYRTPSWRFLGRVQDFQPLVPGAEPYQLRPQLLASGAGGFGLLRYDFRTEYAQFDHDARRPTGQRVDVYPGVSAPLEGDYWFVTPRLAARHTQYLLDGAAGDDEPARSLPLASLDAGLFFERELSIAGESLLQTLEPRLYYLYVPHRDQDDLPVFDTTPTTFSFAQLFRENRYTGPDRVGDANQLTAALSTRFLGEASGRELVRASVGQTFYFQDRRVRLPGETLVQDDYSDMAAELAARPVDALEISANTRWNPRVSETEESAARIRYSPDRLHIIDAAYRVREGGDVKNRDLMVLWPITRNWHALGRWYYDEVAERTLESVVGIEYESCCWTVRLISRDRPVITAAGGTEPDRSIWFTFELKGLASMGRTLENVVEEGIVGYR
ncbi:MAG: LPS-assembly protein LptD [Gammaproteobacteria bacterium]|nr:LPS-assembly protein LptD [Gammaproteobacteria bacterium]